MEEPLSLGQIDMSGVTTAMPVLRSGDYVFKFSSYEVVYKKGDTSKKNLKITFKLDEEAESNLGKPVQPGFPLIVHFPLQGSDNNPNWDFRENIGRMLKACLKLENDSDIPDISDDVMQQCLEKQLVIRVAERTDEAGIESNEAKRYNSYDV